MMRHTALRSLTTGLATLVLVTGCKDGILPSSDGAGSSSLSPLGPVALQDAEIDRTDTHFSLDAVMEGATTLTLAEPVVDPRTGEPTTTLDLSPASRALRVESGYDRAGVFRFSFAHEQSGRKDPLREGAYHGGRFQVVGQRVTLYDGDGQQLDSFGSDQVPGLPDAPFMSLEHPSIAGGLFLDSMLVIPNGNAGAEKTDRYGRTGRGPGGSPAVAFRGNDRLEITTTAGSAANPATFVRRYRKFIRSEGGERIVRWVLDETEFSSQNVHPKGTMKNRQVTRFRNVQWHENRDKDRRRYQAREEKRVQWEASGGLSSTLQLSASSRRPGPAAPAPGPARFSMNTAGDLGPCGREGPDYGATLMNPGGANLVYQHGICSSAATWDGMKPRVGSLFSVGWEQAWSLDDNEPLEDQTIDLEGKVSASGITNNVIISHSQGGLIARRLGQRRPDLVRGVITISSPHYGALIAQQGTGALTNAISPLIPDFCDFYGVSWRDGLCGLTKELKNALLESLLTFGTESAMPVVRDDRPGSAFINSLNGSYEQFPRVSIANSVGTRWAWARVLGDVRSARTDFNPKGGQYVSTTERLYQASIGAQILAQLITDWVSSYGFGCDPFGYYTWGDWVPCNPYEPYDPFNRWYQSAAQMWWLRVAYWLYDAAYFVQHTLDDIDATWDYMTTGHADGSDGFIQFSSQHYPNSPGAYSPLHKSIYNSHSHTGETASPKVFAELQPSLDYMGVPRRY
jgi:pimeloyl-ACP methyl ester carboxylesterase